MKWPIMALTHQVHRATILSIKNINLRLAIICISAAFVGLSMAISSIAKRLLPDTTQHTRPLPIFGAALSIRRDTLGMKAFHARAAQSALFALVVDSLFNASIHDALIGDFFCVLIGLLLALGFSKQQPTRTSCPNKSKQLEPAPQ